MPSVYEKAVTHRNRGSSRALHGGLCARRARSGHFQVRQPSRPGRLERLWQLHNQGPILCPGLMHVRLVPLSWGLEGAHSCKMSGSSGHGAVSKDKRNIFKGRRTFVVAAVDTLDPSRKGCLDNLLPGKV